MASAESFVFCGEQEGHAVFAHIDQYGTEQFRTVVDTAWGEFASVASTADGGWLVTGQWGPDFDPDLLIARFNSTGTMTASWVLGTDGHSDVGQQIIRTLDGNLAIFGRGGPGPGPENFIIHLDDAGVISDTLWLATAEYRHAFCQTQDGGYVFATYSVDGSHPAILEKVDASGAPLWQLEVGVHAVARNVIELEDGTLAGCGTVDSSMTGSKAFLFRATANGDLLWARAYGISSDERSFRDVTQGSDGRLIAIGHYDQEEVLGEEYYPNTIVVSVSLNGNTLWERMVGDADERQEGRIVLSTPYGSVFCVSSATVLPTGSLDYLVQFFRCTLSGQPE